MWSIGYIAVPILFAQLENRAMAGELAGFMFTIVNYIGLFSAGFLFLYRLIEYGRPSRQHWHSVLLMIMFVLTAVIAFGLQPQMAALKAAGLTPETMVEFSRLHGISSVVYLVNSVLGFVAVLTFSHTRSPNDRLFR